MTNTTSRIPGIVVPHRASGYEMDRRTPINRDYDLTDLFSAGAIISTVLDMGKWDAAWDEDDKLQKESEQGTM